MTTEQLKQKHVLSQHWNASIKTAEKHSAISIEFAISCLKEVSTKHYELLNEAIENKINQLKQNI